ATQKYLADKKHFPRGALWRSPSAERVIDWRPDQRLSWMVDLLPYLDGGAWKDLDIDRNASWDEGKNKTIAMAVIPQFLGRNGGDLATRYVAYPRGPGEMAGGATAHFVGVAGIGLDAALYRADDPRTARKLGIFGYDRVTKPEDIKDGLDKTILLLQVPGTY